MSNIYIQEPPTNGKVLLKTTVGDIDVELWPKEAPKACRNFVQLCLEGYYNNTIFHRVVKGFIIQGGDPTGSGTGGESIYRHPFKDEFHSRLRFCRRGLVAMANAGRDDNGSQFFFTLAAAPELQNKHTIFAKVTRETIYNVLKLQETLVDKDERPLYPQKILKAEVLNNPFNDIIPRVLPSLTDRAEEKKKEKRSGVKNFKLLSFGEEAEEDEEASSKANERYSGRSKSTHDLLKDPKLSAVPAVEKRGSAVENDGKFESEFKAVRERSVSNRRQENEEYFEDRKRYSDKRKGYDDKVRGQAFYEDIVKARKIQGREEKFEMDKKLEDDKVNSHFKGKYEIKLEMDNSKMTESSRTIENEKEKESGYVNQGYKLESNYTNDDNMIKHATKEQESECPTSDGRKDSKLMNESSVKRVDVMTEYSERQGSTNADSCTESAVDNTSVTGKRIHSDESDLQLSGDDVHSDSSQKNQININRLRMKLKANTLNKKIKVLEGEEEKDDLSKKDNEKISGIRKQIKSLKQELKHLKKEQPKEKPEAEVVEESNEVDENGQEDEYLHYHQKYKSLKRKIPTKGTSREEFTMGLLAKFQMKLAYAKDKVQTDDKKPKPEDEPGSPASDDDNWLTHKLHFVSSTPNPAKDASTKTDDWFEIYDPRNPITKRRREASKEVMRQKERR